MDASRCIWNNGEPCKGKIAIRKIFRGQLTAPMCVSHFVWHLKRSAIVYSGAIDGEKAIGLSSEEADNIFSSLPEYPEAQAVIVSALYGSTADLDSTMFNIF